MTPSCGGDDALPFDGVEGSQSEYHCSCRLDPNRLDIRILCSGSVGYTESEKCFCVSHLRAKLFSLKRVALFTMMSIG